MLIDSLASIPKKVTPRVWVSAPTFPLVEEDWRVAVQEFGPVIVDRNVAKMRLLVGLSQSKLPHTQGRVGEIEFKSAERGDEGLRGAGLVGVLMDEAARTDRAAWELGLRPALADYRGRAVFVSTPFGLNWFKDLYDLGQGGDADWKSWRFPSNVNPYFPQDEWEKIKQTAAESTFRQEYLAEFVEGEGAVFHALDKVAETNFCLYDPALRWTIGADLAKTTDFTVLYVMNDYGEPAEIIRFKDISWNVQQEAIQKLSNRYGHACVYLDSSGVGDPVEDNLRRIGVPVRGVKTGTVTTKQELIEGLSIALEQGWIKLPYRDTHRWLWDELESYQKRVTEFGNTQYYVPSGRHDDGVIALSLAVHGVGARLGRSRRSDEVEKEEDSYTKWGDYWKSVNPRRKHRVPVIPGAGGRLQKAFRFRVMG